MSNIRTSDVCKWLLLQFGVAAAYFVSARVGLALAFMHTNVSPVWPPSGVALAAVLIFGYRAWPAIVLGVIGISWWTEPSLPTTVAVVIGVGNSLEAICGAWLIRKLTHRADPLDTPRDFLAFLGAGVLGATTISATIGVAALCCGDMANCSASAALWWTWWLGDATGTLLVTPVLLAAWNWRPHWPAAAKAVECGGFLALLALVCYGVFFRTPEVADTNHFDAVLLIPVLVWAAFRLGKFCTALAILACSAVAVWCTVNGFGPFVQNDVNEALVSTQVGLGLIAGTVFLLAALASRHRHAEHDLRRQTSVLKSILENLADGVAVSDEHGRWMHFNPAATQLVGVEVTEGTPNQWSEHFGLFYDEEGEIYPPHELPLYRAMRGEIVRDAELYIRNENVPEGRYLSISATPLLDERGRRHGGIAVFRDVTQHKHAEKAIQQSAAIISCSDDAIISVGLDGRILSWNHGAQRMLGFTAVEVVDQSVEILHPPDLRSNLDGLRERLLSGESVTNFETRRLHKSGREVPISMTVSLLRDEKGRIEGLCGILRDITERKKAEDKLRHEQKLLRELLEIQDRERQMLTHEIHDGFVQYVVGAKMNFEVSCCRADDTFDTSCERGLKLLRKAIAEARRLIGGLRPLVIEEQGIVEAIRDLIAELASDFGLIVAFAHDVQFTRLNSTLEGVIFRIIQEALNNVHRHAETVHAAVRMQQQGERLRIEIRDCGVGFNPDDVPANRFGLRGIRERVRLFDGVATVHSAPGEGTMISVDIPLVLPEDS